MPAVVPPEPRRSNPHIRLNSNTTDLVLPDFLSSGNLHHQPKRASVRPLVRNAPLAREDTSTLSIYSIKDATSTEHLLPPKPHTRPRRNKDDLPPAQDPSGASPPRRLPWDFRGDSRRSSGYGATGSIHDSTISSITPSSTWSSVPDQEEHLTTETVAERYNIMPSEALILFPEDVEQDDWLHTPDADDKRIGCDLLSRRSLVNLGGLALLAFGVLMVFIGYPVLTYILLVKYPPASRISCSSDSGCIAEDVPLLRNVRTSLIDPDTPSTAMRRTARDGTVQQLVFSDEFNQDGRTFYPGDDPYFQAVDLWYGNTQDLEWYDPDAVTTSNGTLTIRFDAFQNHNMNYRSGMLQSWNKMCFKSGYMEASASLPGSGDTIGFWPGFWAMGNLGRPGYTSTTDGMWPYSYWDGCDYGITKNQSQLDGLNYLPGMRLPACTCSNEDHPSPGNSRSAPEIDALEASVLYLDPPNKAAIGSASQSAQFAPFDIWYQPNYDFVEIYDESITSMNNYRGGVYQQAVSGVTNLNNGWYDGKAYQTYAFEYVPGSTGYITWYVGETPSWTLDARAVGPNGNIGQRVIPQEPMAIVANIGMSNSFAVLNLTGIASLLPVTMRFDYIRVYQDADGHVGCDPPGYPTTEYIESHPGAYLDPNKTLWEETGYEWPKNSFVDGCEV